MKIEKQNKPRSNCTGKITTPKMVFPEYHYIHGPPTLQPTDIDHLPTDPPTTNTMPHCINNHIWKT